MFNSNCCLITIRTSSNIFIMGSCSTYKHDYNFFNHLIVVRIFNLTDREDAVSVWFAIGD